MTVGNIAKSILALHTKNNQVQKNVSLTWKVFRDVFHYPSQWRVVVFA